MAYSNSRSVRFQDDLEVASVAPSRTENAVKLIYKIDGTQIQQPSSRKINNGPGKTRKSLKAKVLSRVFSEDYERVKKKILDPRGLFLNSWNKVFLVACLVSLFVDPLLFFLPGSREEACIEIKNNLAVALTIVRSIVDVFYMIQIFIRFRTAFIAPSSRVFGRGELVIDPSKIASRYLAKGFWIDLVAALPLPQATGVVTETAWAGAAYNLMLYMLASHVLGACWYLLSVDRQEACWKQACDFEKTSCRYRFFDCQAGDSLRDTWFKSSNITNLCNPDSGFYLFGIYADAVNYSITSASFFSKYFYCLWWGLRNLSSLGQNLMTSIYVGEISFAIVIAILGLVLFGLLIGNMQTYLQSTTVRLEEWRIRRMDTEQWMRHRQLPPELRQCVRRYDQYKWAATRGVDEEDLLKGLPMDLRRHIKRHLCLDLVRRVPLFDQMDERMLDAICERLKPALYTPDTCLVREGDPVNEMLFIIRGHLDSFTTNGGRTGFFNSIRIGPGDFAGEELLTWALDPRPGVVLPSSTRTVRAISEVEAFALFSDDLKFVAAQFRRLHSKQLRHKFRFYSHQWRTWAACFIQAAWRRQKRRRSSVEISRSTRESLDLPSPSLSFPAAGARSGELQKAPAASSAVALYASRLTSSTRRPAGKNSKTTAAVVSSLPKPTEPDFTEEGDD